MKKFALFNFLLLGFLAHAQMPSPYAGTIKTVKTKQHIYVEYSGIRGLVKTTSDTTLLVKLLKKGTINIEWFFDQKLMDNCCGPDNDEITRDYKYYRKELYKYKGKYLIFDDFTGSGTKYELGVEYRPTRGMVHVFVVTFDKDPRQNEDVKVTSLEFSYMPY